MSKKDKEVKDNRMISSFSLMIKQKKRELTNPSSPTDIADIKAHHRQGIANLMNKYYEDVDSGKAEGIKSVKELVEVMKLDMLLLGEATERTASTTDIDEVKLSKFSQTMLEDVEDNPDMQSMVNAIFSQLNGYNDSQDDAPEYKGDIPDVSEDVQVYSQSKEEVIKEIEEQNKISEDKEEPSVVEIAEGITYDIL